MSLTYKRVNLLLHALNLSKQMSEREIPNLLMKNYFPNSTIVNIQPLQKSFVLYFHNKINETRVLF